MAKTSPELPLGPLPDLSAWWRKSKVRGMIIGAMAVAFLGRPRTTRDIDALIFVEEDRWPAFLKTGEEFSFEPRIDDALSFARQSRVFLLRHQNSGIDLDLTLGALDFERQVFDRAQKVKIGRFSFLMPTPEDLIILKAVANRSKDLLDIEGLLDRWPTLDYAHIRRHVEEFTQALEMPEVFENMNRMLLKHEKQQNQ